MLILFLGSAMSQVSSRAVCRRSCLKNVLFTCSPSRGVCQTSPEYQFQYRRPTEGDKPGPKLSSAIAISNEAALKLAKPYKDMPKVPMIPWFGSSWAYSRFIGRYRNSKLHVADIHKNRLYGNVVRDRFGQLEMVTSYNPDTMRIISENEGPYPARTDFACLKVYRQKRKDWFEPDGFLAAQGKEWHDLRESLTRYLSQPQYLKNYLDSLGEIALDFVDLISVKRDGKKEVDDAVVFLRRWALECITRVTLNTRLGSLSPNLDSESDSIRILKAVETQLACMYKLEVASANMPLWKYIPTPTWRKFKKAADEFTSLSYKYISRSVNVSTAQFNNLKEGKTPTFLQFLLLEEGVSLSSAVVTVADIILAGLDKMSCTAAFLLYNLAKNPEKQELAYKEVLGLLPNEGDKMTPEVYDKIVYLKYCLAESMRLLPTVRGNVRVLDKDVAIDGYRVPAGTAIMCGLQVIHRNEKYFKDANSFIPERWDDSRIAEMNEFAYQPLGYGKRSCLGKKLAEMELMTLLAEVLRRYAVEYHYQDIDMFTRLINVPDKPLRMKFVDRKASQRTNLIA